jgi:hypothetical protein
MAIFPSKHSSKPDFCICFVKFIYESLESALKVQIYFSTLVKYTVLKFSILAAYSCVHMAKPARSTKFSTTTS